MATKLIIICLAASTFHLSTSQSPAPPAPFCLPICPYSCQAGPPGSPGPRGSKGYIGYSGPSGPRGYTGLTGPRGPKGSRGITVSGPRGRDGLPGVQGIKGDIGPPGPPGAHAWGRPCGPCFPGPVGPPGEAGSPGSPGQPGNDAYKNWKQCAWNQLNDNRDYGKLKECIFTKRASNTALKVEFIGDYRVCCCLDCCKRWYFTFNGVECRRPQPIDGVHHIANNHFRTDTNIHKTGVIAGYCEGISRGTIRVAIHTGNCAGKKAGPSFTGYNSVTRIMIEEVPPAQQ